MFLCFENQSQLLKGEISSDSMSPDKCPLEIVPSHAGNKDARLFCKKLKYSVQMILSSGEISDIRSIICFPRT